MARRGGVVLVGLLDPVENLELRYEANCVWTHTGNVELEALQRVTKNCRMGAYHIRLVEGEVTTGNQSNYMRGSVIAVQLTDLVGRPLVVDNAAHGVGIIAPPRSCFIGAAPRRYDQRFKALSDVAIRQLGADLYGYTVLLLDASVPSKNAQSGDQFPAFALSREPITKHEFAKAFKNVLFSHRLASLICSGFLEGRTTELP